MPKKKGRTLVLLHGGLSDSASMMRAVGPYLKEQFVLAAFDRRGHGRTADTDEPFSYDEMASETIAFIEELDRAVYLLGHSDGGNVALIVAQRRPDLVRRVVVVGANFHYDGLVPLDDFTPESEGFAEFAVDFCSAFSRRHRTRLGRRAEVARAGEDPADHVRRRSTGDRRCPCS